MRSEGYGVTVIWYPQRFGTPWYQSPVIWYPLGYHFTAIQVRHGDTALPDIMIPRALTACSSYDRATKISTCNHVRAVILLPEVVIIVITRPYCFKSGSATY